MIWFSPKGLAFSCCHHIGAEDFNLNFRATLTYSVPSEEQRKEYKNERIKEKEGETQAYRVLKAKRVNISQRGPNGAGHGLHLPRWGLFVVPALALCPHCCQRSWTVVTCEVDFSSKFKNLLLIYSSSMETLPQTDWCSKNKRLKKLRWPCLPCYAF